MIAFYSLINCNIIVSVELYVWTTPLDKMPPAGELCNSVGQWYSMISHKSLSELKNLVWRSKLKAVSLQSRSMGGVWTQRSQATFEHSMI